MGASDGTYTLIEHGMSRRDYFAGQALSVLANRDEIGFKEIVLECYRLADLMLAEREKET